MAVEVSAAALSFEHGDFVRAVMCEMTEPEFDIKSWRVHVSRWRQIGVIDAKTAFDSLQGDGVPADRRTAIDIASLRSDLEDESNTGVRWVPGPQQIGDDLTKAVGNGLLTQVMTSCVWSLKEDPAVREKRKELRDRAAERKAEKKAADALGSKTLMSTEAVAKDGSGELLST